MAGKIKTARARCRERIDTIVVVLWIAQERRCFYCDRLFSGPRNDERWTPDEWTRDHLFPRCNGHSRAQNLVLACLSCNYDKGPRQPTASEITRAKEVHARALVVGRVLFGREWCWGDAPQSSYDCPQNSPQASRLAELLADHPHAKAAATIR